MINNTLNRTHKVFEPSLDEAVNALTDLMKYGDFIVQSTYDDIERKLVYINLSNVRTLRIRLDNDDILYDLEDFISFYNIRFIQTKGEDIIDCLLENKYFNCENYFIPPEHVNAQIRSDYFAEKTTAIYRHYMEIGIKGYVITLDGRLRNSIALMRAGYPANKIIVIEKQKKVVMYQKIIGAVLGVNVLWSEKSKPNSGIQSFITEYHFYDTPLYDKDIHNYTIGLYADFCGDIPDIEEMIAYLPNINILGITQGKRNVSSSMKDWYIPYIRNNFILIKIMINLKYFANFTNVISVK